MRGSFTISAVVLAFLLALSPAAGIAAAQAPLTPQAASAAPAAAPPAAEDPLGRDTPRGSVLGFVTAAQSGNVTAAAEYLQWPRHAMPITKLEAAEQLRFVLNHGFEGSLDALSRDPRGSYADGLPVDRERAGTVVLADGERFDLYLVRVQPRDGPATWLVAADTVAEIPRLYDNSGLHELERYLPASLTAAQFRELPLWIPIALLLLLPVLYYVSRLALWGLASIVRLARRRRRAMEPLRRSRAWKELARPSAFLLTVGLHRAVVPLVGIPLLYRDDYNRLVIILLLGGSVWWLWHLVDLVAARTRDRLMAIHPRTAQSVYVLGRRIFKGTAVGLAVLVGLAVAGVDLSATLAGLGIGGIALAFVFQKTLENVFGGIAVLSDRSIVVGDFCRIGSFTGEVEDVGLRTTALRTLNRTLVHVPNGTVSMAEVENFSRRDKFWFSHTIALRYETTLEQLQRVLAAIRGMLSADSRAETGTARVRLVKFGAYSLDVEVFAYVKAPDYVAFLAAQEELLLRIMGIVKDAGTALAFPSQTMYVREDPTAGPRGDKRD